jgi:hypothetical protein
VIVFFLQEILNRKLSVIQLLGFKPVVGKEHGGRRMMLKIGQNDTVFYGFFFLKKKNFNRGILVILKPKTTSF